MKKTMLLAAIALPCLAHAQNDATGAQPIIVTATRIPTPADQVPADKRFNPLVLNPYILYKALPQAKKYTQKELIRAMDLLLKCNLRLVSSGLDEALVLQQTLVQIVTPQAAAA